MTTITREEVKAFIEQIESDLSNGWEAQIFELKLARIALASLESEPVAYIFKHPAGELFWSLTDESNKGQNDVMPVYAAPPAPERERIRREHAEWSYKTFGDVGPIGPLKHLSKEALEAAADPSDPLEWADMQFLLWDAQRRAGISDSEITAAMVEKLEINKSRQWPEPKDGEPRLHIKEQPLPVVPEEMNFSTACNFVQINGMAKEDRATLAMRSWNACRAAMLQGVEPVSNHDELALYYLQGQKDGLEWAAQLAEANHPLTGDWLYDDPLDLAKAIRKGPDMPGFAGSSPVIPDGYVLVPLKPTKEMLQASENERGADWQYSVDIWDSMCRATMLNGGKS
ncbi:DUF550 domain-containing protein [Salmonella enterica]